MSQKMDGNFGFNSEEFRLIKTVLVYFITDMNEGKLNRFVVLKKKHARKHKSKILPQSGAWVCPQCQATSEQICGEKNIIIDRGILDFNALRKK